jgi:hypothetical protein
MNCAIACLLLTNLAAAPDVGGMVAAVPAQTRPADPRSSEPRKEPASNPIWGCWRNVEKPTLMIRFEPSRRIVADADVFDVSPVKSYGNDSVLIAVMGTQRRVGFSLRGDTLILTDEQGHKRVFGRLGAVPAELELKGTALGKPEKLPETRTKAIQQELARRLKLDQGARQKLMAASASGKSMTQSEMMALYEEMTKADRDNTRWLKSLVKEIGWIDVSRFGADASNDAFLMVQHSGDFRLLMAALPEIERDVRAKRFKDGQPYALLYDRVRVSLAGKQRYGTQIARNAEGALVVLPLENRAKVEEFRKEIGLMPLSQYLDYVKRATGAKEVVFQED